MWHIDDEGELRLEYRGSLNDSVELRLPEQPSFLLLVRVAHDCCEMMARHSVIYEKWSIQSTKDEICKASKRLQEVIELMPEAYERNSGEQAMRPKGSEGLSLKEVMQKLFT